MSKKLIIFTGSFNPVTKAHTRLMLDAIEFVNADKGLFVCTNDDYLKKKMIVDNKETRPFLLSESERKEMIESLSIKYPKIEFYGSELGGASPSTGRTVNAILRKNPGYEAFFLCGADKLHGIPNWTNIDKILERLDLLVSERDGDDVESIISGSEFLTSLRNENKIHTLKSNGDTLGVSSTELRRRFFGGLDFKDMMDEGPYEIFSRYSPDDFKEITPEDAMRATIKYGGQFGKNAARSLVYNENMKLFQNWDEKRFGNRNAKLNGTKVYREPFKVVKNASFDTAFDCKNIDCTDAALELKNDGLNPTILNLADRFSPAGGYHKGLGAQEESLCQESTLSQSLYQFVEPKFKRFKDARVEYIPNVYPMDINYGGIYSPDVCFFRNGISDFYSLRKETFECGVISVASLSNRYHEGISDKRIMEETSYFDNNGYMTDEGREIEKNKIRTIYRIAIENGHDSLVLGAWGCGAFNLNPDEVSKLFMDTYNEDEFKGAFRKIVFAIFEGKGSSRKMVGPQGKFKPFYDLFESGR